MIYITGDTHADIDIDKLSVSCFPQQESLTKDDYLIICGDFGFVWDGSEEERQWQDWLENKNFTTLWIDGNHENFDLLYRYPVEDKFGGKVRMITPSICHLERGYVFTIEGKKFFVMGGARSVDRMYRTEHVSWWEQEIPSMVEMERGIQELVRHNWKVDYVLTHCAPKRIQRDIVDWFENDPLVSYLDRILDDIEFKMWFFGHYHIDRRMSDQFMALYQDVVAII